jgi:hypothetical protein
VRQKKPFKPNRFKVTKNSKKEKDQRDISEISKDDKIDDDIIIQKEDDDVDITGQRKFGKIVSSRTVRRCLRHQNQS